MPDKKIAIVGAGIIGCSTAYHLSKLFSNDNCEITIISETFSPYTTSDRSSGCVIPFDVTNPPSSDSIEGTGDILRWAKETICHVEELHRSPEVAEIGVTHVYGCEAKDAEYEKPWWSSLVHGYRRITSEEEKRVFNVSAKYDCVIAFGLYILDCRLYLPWLLRNCKKRNVIVKQQKICNLSDLAATYDIVINCTGVAAAKLVPDKDVFPIRGEALSINAPWLKTFVVIVDKSELLFIFPRTTDVVMGGTAQIDDWNDESDDELSESRLKACRKVFPGLEKARVMSTWAGLRPGRSKIRLTHETVPGRSNSIIIHCYGHGSKGIALHWGSALEIGRLVTKMINS